MSNRQAFLLTLLATAAVGCSGDSSPTGPGGTGPVHGSINNVVFSSTSVVQISYLPASHSYGVTADDPEIGGKAVTWSLAEITAPGTYTLGTSQPLRYASVFLNNARYETSFNAGTSSHGTLVVEIASATRFKGTITYVGIPADGYPNATGTANVSMVFDIPIP